MPTRMEVPSTLEMLKNEHLDVPTITLGISLLDCASYEVAVRYGIPTVNKRIAINPIAVAAVPVHEDGALE